MRLQRGHLEQQHFSNWIRCGRSQRTAGRVCRVPELYLLDALARLLFSFWFFRSAAASNGSGKTRRLRGKVSWQGCDWCFGEKSDLGNDHTGFVRGSARRRYGVDADFRGSNSTLGYWLTVAGCGAMPAIGAFAMALMVAHLPPMKQAGQALLWCVFGFGIATVLFGLSKIFWLSLALLLFLGAFDSVSVIIRGFIVQLVTPGMKCAAASHR